jgi:hypothetical protein
MSYNLMVEGDLDFVELAMRARQLAPRLELFPIPEEGGDPSDASVSPTAPDAIGVALPRSQSGPAAVNAMRSVVELAWTKGARVFDLYSGEEIATTTDLDQLAERIA